MKIRPVGAELFHVDGRTDDRHDEASSRFLQLRTHLETKGTFDPVHTTKTYDEAGVHSHIFLVLCYLEVSSPVFLNRRAAARYRALASIIPGRERFFWN
jgi:hypothetical protein